MADRERSKRISRVLKKYGGLENLDVFLDEVLCKLKVDSQYLAEFPKLEEIKSLESVVDQLESIVNSLEDKVETSKRDLELSTRDLSSANRNLVEVNALIEIMLNSVDEAYFIFDKNGDCLNFSSQRCEDLLEVRPNNKKLKSVLKVKEQDSHYFETWIKMLFSGNIDFEDAAPLGIDRFENPKKFISISYLPMMQEDRLVGVVGIARDLTSIKRAEQQKREMNEKSVILLNIQNSKAWFESFFDFFEKGLSFYKNGNGKSNVSLKEFRRYLHTIKGTSYTLGLNTLGDFLHEIEDDFLDFHGKEAISKISAFCEKIEKEFKGFLEKYDDVFKLLSERKVELPLMKLLNMATELFVIDQEVSEKFCEDFLMVELGEYLANMEGAFEQISNRNRKLVKFQFDTSDKVKIFTKRYEKLLYNLTHLYSNAIVHGIEDSEERSKRGKAQIGLIKTKCSNLDKNTFSISIKDDGRGINLELLAEKLKVDRKSVSDKELILRLFEDKVSTLDEANHSAGRGIGLSSIKETLDELDGEIKVLTEKGKATEFILNIPKKDLKVEIDLFREQLKG